MSDKHKKPRGGGLERYYTDMHSETAQFDHEELPFACQDEKDAMHVKYMDYEENVPEEDALSRSSIRPKCVCKHMV